MDSAETGRYPGGKDEKKDRAVQLFFITFLSILKRNFRVNGGLSEMETTKLLIK